MASAEEREIKERRKGLDMTLLNISRILDSNLHYIQGKISVVNENLSDSYKDTYKLTIERNKGFCTSLKRGSTNRPLIKAVMSEHNGGWPGLHVYILNKIPEEIKGEIKDSINSYCDKYSDLWCLRVFGSLSIRKGGEISTSVP